MSRLRHQRRKCVCCRAWFVPDPRKRGRQRYCSEERCQPGIHIGAYREADAMPLQIRWTYALWRRSGPKLASGSDIRSELRPVTNQPVYATTRIGMSRTGIRLLCSSRCNLVDELGTFLDQSGI